MTASQPTPAKNHTLSQIQNRAKNLQEPMQDDSGIHDYTQERHQWLESLTLEDIWADIQELKNRP